ncbi:MAG: hypothetical protein IT461_02355 [Planctomycetes bacterium]|nr:hypothetical protein [Planctomycetota bacterium]
MTALLNRLGLAALICAAFISTIYAAPDRTPPKEAEEEEEEPVDEALSDMMLKMYSDGTMKAMYAARCTPSPRKASSGKRARSRISAALSKRPVTSGKSQR